MADLLKELAETVIFFTDAAYEESNRCPLCRAGPVGAKKHADWCLYVRAKEAVKPAEFCDVCPHNLAFHDADGNCGCGMNCAEQRSAKPTTAT